MVCESGTVQSLYQGMIKRAIKTILLVHNLPKYSLLHTYS